MFCATRRSLRLTSHPNAERKDFFSPNSLRSEVFIKFVACLLFSFPPCREFSMRRIFHVYLGGVVVVVAHRQTAADVAAAARVWARARGAAVSVIQLQIRHHFPSIAFSGPRAHSGATRLAVDPRPCDGGLKREAVTRSPPRHPSLSPPVASPLPGNLCTGVQRQ